MKPVLLLAWFFLMVLTVIIAWRRTYARTQWKIINSCVAVSVFNIAVWSVYLAMVVTQ